MAGSGEFSRVGNQRALNANLGSAITGGAICPGADLVASLSAATPAVGTAGVLVSTAAAGGGAVFTKAIPDDAVLVVMDSAGAVDTMEAVTVNGAVASGAASATIDSHYWSIAHAAGSAVFLLAFKPYLALVLNSGAPTDNSLGSEYTQTGYVRQLVPWVAPTNADPPVASNQLSTTFGPLTGANGADVVGYASLRDSLTGGATGNQYAWWTFAATRTPQAGDSINIAAAALQMQCYH
jgi:hypothetical protein